MNNKLVTVIIPTYKSGKDVIFRAVDSVLFQTYTNIEIIVVDDNSPEWPERAATEQAMTKYEDNIKVHYLKHDKNRNGSAARNTGIKFSHGDYIAFLDDDDWFLPSKIEKQVAFLESHTEFQGVYCLAQRDGKPIQTTPYEGNVSKELLLMKSHMYTPSLCFRKEAVLAINGFDESFRRHQDYEFLLRFFGNDFKMGCVKEILIELGKNGVVNMSSPEKAIELKEKFFSTFEDYINTIDSKSPGFRRQVLATHYGSILVMAFRKLNFKVMILVIMRYMWFSPIAFWSPMSDYLKDFTKRKILRLFLNNA